MIGDVEARLCLDVEGQGIPATDGQGPGDRRASNGGELPPLQRSACPGETARYCFGAATGVHSLPLPRRQPFPRRDPAKPAAIRMIFALVGPGTQSGNRFRAGRGVRAVSTTATRVYFQRIPTNRLQRPLPPLSRKAPQFSETARLGQGHAPCHPGGCRTAS